MIFLLIIIIILFIVLITIMIINFIKQNKTQNSDIETNISINKIFTGIDDNSISGIISPYFCSGNPFNSGNYKISFETFNQRFPNNLFNFPNKIKKINVFGVGDQNGTGWLGGDSAASIQLSNGDLLFTFGDSFICKIDSPNIWLSYRNKTLITMPHNSLSYLKIDKLNKNEIKQNIFFIGQSRQNLVNSLGLDFDKGCNFNFNNDILKNYKSSPYYFQPNGCNSII